MTDLRFLVADEKRFRQGHRFDIKKFCYPKQLAFVEDPSPFATAVTTRRSGKTWGCAADHIRTALGGPSRATLYITLTRSNAKKIMFPVLCQINRDYRLGGDPNISDLSLTFPNRSVIYLAGVNDSQAIHNFRGLKFALVTIDEGQSMRPYIEELIDDVLSPSLIDENGRLRVTGTPGAVPVGYFHKIAHSNQWNHHFFTMFDNPYLPNPKERLELELKRRGVTVDDPSIQREFFGKWALDVDSLVIHYDASIANYDALPQVSSWDHILSVDLGFEDSDAIAVIAFSEDCPSAFLVHEEIKNKQGVTELANKLNVLVEKYKPMRMVMDTGGLGKKIAEEIRRRYGLPIEAADKNRKFEYIELLNDALRTGRFRAKSNSVFAQDAMLLEWEVDLETRKRTISNRFHSDAIDAVLYGFRESLHHLYEPKASSPKPGTREFIDAEEREIWEKAEEAWAAKKESEAFWSDPFED